MKLVNEVVLHYKFSYLGLLFPIFLGLLPGFILIADCGLEKYFWVQIAYRIGTEVGKNGLSEFGRPDVVVLNEVQNAVECHGGSRRRNEN